MIFEEEEQTLVMTPSVLQVVQTLGNAPLWGNKQKKSSCLKWEGDGCRGDMAQLFKIDRILNAPMSILSLCCLVQIVH